MKDLYKIEDIVKHIMTEYPETKADDFLLINEVYSYLDTRVDDPLFPLSFSNVMKNHVHYNLPSFESITRARRKLQAEDEALRPEIKVRRMRINSKKTYMEYALDNNVSYRNKK